MSAFQDDNFEKVSDGKGKWQVQYGGITENVKYTNDNFINSAGTIAYCKIVREDGVEVHVFLSKMDKKEIVTTTGVKNAQMEIGQTLLNSIDPKTDVDGHYASHVKCFQGKAPAADKKTLEKELKNLPGRVYELGTQAVIKAMGL